MKYSQKKELLNLLCGTGFTLSVSSIFCELTLAQIRSDTTLGAEQSTILTNGSDDLITGGARREGNLFHSFEEFNVNNKQNVYFNNPDGVTRIFSRVTGGRSSSILGKLGVWDTLKNQIGSADLFLINPNGILFGPKASLHLGGSFISSTASSIIFTDGTEFSALNPSSPSLLTINLPVGLRFGTQVGSIRNQSTDLSVGINRTLALVGGEIILDENSFTTTGLGTGIGRIEIGGVGAQEQVSLHDVEQGWAIGYDTVQSFADIFMQPSAFVGIKATPVNLEGAEEIQFYGKNIILNAAQIVAFSGKNVQPAKITLHASESIELGGRTVFFEDSIGSSVGTTNISSNAERTGDIEIVAKNLRLLDTAAITTGTEMGSTVPGGNIKIAVDQSIQLTEGSFISASTSGKGRAGNISITTEDLQILRGAAITAITNSKGSGGNLVINARTIELSGQSSTTLDGAEISVSSEQEGTAGNLNINASSIHLSDYGTLSAETKAGEGNITLQVQNDTILRTNSSITTNATGNAIGGNITINTGVLAAFEDSSITADAKNAAGGKVIINTQGIFRTPDIKITATSARGVEFNGIVELNTPEIDPSQGLLELPEAVINPTALVAQNPCKQGKASELTISGRGGLPPSINEDLSSGAVQVGLVEPVPTQSRQTEETKSSTPATSTTIEPAQGWIFNEKGEVVLTAYNSIITEPQRLPSNSATCSTP